MKKYKPNIAKRTVRSFERRFNDEVSSWPDDLQALGAYCLLAIKMIPGQEHLLKYPAFVECVLPPITKFETAYAAYQRRIR